MPLNITFQHLPTNKEVFRGCCKSSAHQTSKNIPKLKFWKLAFLNLWFSSSGEAFWVLLAIAVFNQTMIVVSIDKIFIETFIEYIFILKSPAKIVVPEMDVWLRLSCM